MEKKLHLSDSTFCHYIILPRYNTQKKKELPRCLPFLLVSFLQQFVFTLIHVIHTSIRCYLMQWKQAAICFMVEVCFARTSFLSVTLNMWQDNPPLTALKNTFSLVYSIEGMRRFC